MQAAQVHTSSWILRNMSPPGWPSYQAMLIRPYDSVLNQRVDLCFGGQRGLCPGAGRGHRQPPRRYLQPMLRAAQTLRRRWLVYCMHVPRTHAFPTVSHVASSAVEKMFIQV